MFDLNTQAFTLQESILWLIEKAHGVIPQKNAKTFSH